METFLNFVANYGYYAVFLGALVEGESVIFTACSLAAMGKLNLYKIMIVAFWGTFIADQLLYMLGRRYGSRIFERFPKISKGSERAFRLLNKYDTWFIIACRFIYGIRVSSSVVIGVSGLPPKRYVPLNFLSAVIWTIVSCYAGFYIGEAFLTFLHKMMDYQKWIIGGALSIVLGVWGVKKWKEKQS